MQVIRNMALRNNAKSRRLRRMLMAAGVVYLSSPWAVAGLTAERNICEREMISASQVHAVPLGVLYAVGMTETGNKGSLHPYALNIEGKAVFAGSRDEAMEAFKRARKNGKKLIDLGCMQINHYYHGSKFDSVEEMLEPRRNVEYAAKFLSELRFKEGSWTMAVARYHAGPNNNPAQKRYVCMVIANLVASDFGAWTPESKKFCR
jgi:soluble lytic murein transglycosylase-like protein